MSAIVLSNLTHRLREDLQVAMDPDPAARSALEVLLAYPGVHALWLHRAAHRLWSHGHTLTPRILSHLSRFLTGIEIHPGATLGRKVFIDHGMGVVIGETAEVGDGCVIYKGVVLGGVSHERVRRHPRLGRDVIVGSNACILGAIEIGDGARVGSGSVVIRDVPAGATVVGVPGRVVTSARGKPEPAHANLPDPVAEALEALRARVEALEGKSSRPRQLKGKSDSEPIESDPFDGAVEGRRRSTTPKKK
jgi:serine O-acetyltransferase